MGHLAEIFILIMLAIVFLQSGIDKVVDWNGNLGWLKGHFANTPIKNMVPFSLGLVTLLEMSSGITAVIGIIMLYCNENTCWAFISGILSSITFLMLFLGQRLAKDYPGAQTIVIYLIPTVFLLYLLQG
jgi:uncharacterized membrane protein YphA (DoxX/SURF4 family)